MRGQMLDAQGAQILVVTADDAPLAAESDALDLIGMAMEYGADRLLLDAGALAPEFTQLANGIAGEVLQKLVNYRITGAAVLPQEAWSSGRFGELALEANKGRVFRIFSNRDDALLWLAQV